MISYCIACYRPLYARLLLEELVKKTSCDYEILLWLNVDDTAFESSIAEQQQKGGNIRIVGRTPENIGMVAYKSLFAEARFNLIVQIDDDVIRVSPNIAQKAHAVFRKYPKVKQLVADVWQDEWTSGSRPPLERYQVFCAEDGLYQGPIDGWFSIYHRSLLPLLMQVPYEKYIFIGFWVSNQLRPLGYTGLLCQQFKVLHLEGPYYAALFGQHQKEVEKYRSVGRDNVAGIYEKAKASLPARDVLKDALLRAVEHVDNYTG